MEFEAKSAAPYLWQQAQWQRLLSSVKTATLPHALLFAGPQGLGKFDFAHAFSKLILCENQSVCGQCRSCQLISAGTHPDFLLIRPEAETKVIKIDQIRQLVSRLEKTAQLGSYQVVIIEPAEQMNTAAANALLKTLEEPQGQVIILLISHQVANLPATIRSRCQTVLFKPPMSEAAQSWLATQTKDNAGLLLKLAENAPLLAQTFASTSQLQRCDILLEQLQQLHSGKILSTQLANLYLKEEPKQLLYSLISLVMDMIRLKLNLTDEQHLVHTDKITSLTQLSRNVSAIRLFDYYDQILQTQQLLCNHSSVNLQLQLENLFIRWTHALC